MSAATSDMMGRLRATWGRLAWGWGDLRRVLGAKGLWPQYTTLASTARGARWKIVGQSRISVADGAPQALLIDERDVLWGELRLPPVASGALGAAVTEALWRVSPLPPDQVLSAWRATPDAADGWIVDWGVCPLRLVEQGRAELNLPADAPVYLARGAAEALPAQGAAVQGARQQQRRLDAMAVGGLCVVAAALMVPAVMPLVLKRNAVVRGMSHLTTVEPMAAPLRQKLDELHELGTLSSALDAERQHSLPLASAVERLAQVLPTDAWLDRLEASDRQVRMMGLTPDATELMARLSRVAEFGDLRTTAPTVRDEGQNRERFALEFTWRDAATGAAQK